MKIYIETSIFFMHFHQFAMLPAHFWNVSCANN
eukprot:UN25157